MDFAIIPDKVSDVLHYNPDTGDITWKVTRGPKAKGTIAGTRNHDGYICIKVFQTLYMAHRLAWFLHYGYNPLTEIDHSNRVRDDNRLSNLRLATREQNMLNNGFDGITWRQSRGRGPWRVIAILRTKHLYQGDNIMLAHFHRYMAIQADLPLGLPHCIDTGTSFSSTSTPPI
jgi:hypothetical protein